MYRTEKRKKSIILHSNNMYIAKQSEQKHHAMYNERKGGYVRSHHVPWIHGQDGYTTKDLGFP